jgi:DNA-binding transcriptional LysR family regulator
VEIIMSFDTRLLTGAGVLAAVTETGNFARAAEMLGLTPSGVSRAVARLETRVGVRLFNRNPREVTLTEEGHRFHAQVMPLLAGLEEAAADAAGAAAVVSGRLRVSVDPWFARMVLAPKLQQFMARHPLLSVDLMTSNYREEMMTGVDVAIRFGPPDTSSLIARKLLETSILTCAAPAYLEKHGEPRTPHDLIHHELLLYRDPQTGRAFPWEFHRGGQIIQINATGRLMMDDPSVGVAACIAGQGVLQKLAIGLEPLLANRELVQILSRWSDERYPLYAYHPSRHLPPAKVRAFLDFVQEIAAPAVLATGSRRQGSAKTNGRRARTD